MNSTRQIALGLAGIGIVAGAIVLNPLATSTPASAGSAERTEAAAGAFTIDPVHASAIFKVKHLNATNFYGRFDSISGMFTLGDTASFDVTVKADSVDTNNDKRNNHIKSPDFFSAKEFPEIKCVGKEFKKSGDGTWRGTGNLTFRGVTKPVELTITQTGAGKGMGGQGQVAGIETTFTIKRSDYGAKGFIGPVSDEVTLIVALEGGAE